MSTPFPLEEEAQRDTGQPAWDPWKEPTRPSWYSGFGFTEDTAYLGPIERLAAAAGSMAAKGEQVLGGVTRLAGEAYGAVGKPRVVGEELVPIGGAIQADARQRLRALQPDPQTTGLAVQTLHSLGENIGGAIVGAGLGGPIGAFSVLAATEGYGAYADLLEQGVRPSVAASLGTVRGALAGAGAVTPMAFGASLIPRLATGMASNVGYGITGRAIDSSVLRLNGYDEMADQEQVFDRAQLFVDLALGAGFGAWAHIEHGPALKKALDRDPTSLDAALLANLALRNRASGPGVPVDPGSSGAHAAALVKALNDLQDGQHVEVGGTGVEESTVLTRGGQENPELLDLFAEHARESGILEEQAKLEQLEQILGRKIAGVPEPETTTVTAEGNYSGESVASTEAINRVREEEAAGQDRFLIDSDGNMTPIRGVEAIDAKAPEGSIIVQKGVGAEPYTILDRGGLPQTHARGLLNRALASGTPLSELSPLSERLANDGTLRAGLEAMKTETGWAQQGGRLLMDENGKVLGRTKWIPREEWWRDRPKGLTEDQVHAAIDKAIAGKSLTKREAKIVQFMTEVHDERVQRAGVQAELEAAVPGAPAPDLTVLLDRAGEFDAEAVIKVIDSWEDDSPGTLARIQDELERIIGRGHETPGLEAQAAGAREPAPTARTPRAVDLFGEDRSREQRLADETRRRDLARSPQRDVAIETGRPDDLFSQATRQLDLTDRLFAQPFPETSPLARAKPPETGAEAPITGSESADRLATAALAERPGLTITEPDGSTVPAADAKLRADEELARAKQAAPSLFQAAADCFMRNG